MARLAQLVGEDLGLDNEERDVVVRAAELHDIGKMAMPDSILRKPGPLSESEWEIMRRHTVVGERILSSVPALGPVATVVRSTHERIDGEGYPDGLAGEQIPLGSRIVFVCDAYNAMRTERAYDSAHTHQDAVAELRRCAGTKFDPVVVEALCRIVPEYMRVGDPRGEEAAPGRRPPRSAPGTCAAERGPRQPVAADGGGDILVGGSSASPSLPQGQSDLRVDQRGDDRGADQGGGRGRACGPVRPRSS